MKKVIYDKEAQAMYVSVSEGKIDHSKELTSDIILDRTRDGELVGIDILNVELPKELGKPGRLLNEEEIAEWAEWFVSQPSGFLLNDGLKKFAQAQLDQRGE